MCAMMFPQKEDIADLPFSEREVYEFLEKLGDNYVVFHSVQWMKRSNKWKSTWKENDFLILHKKFGALVLEVKGGDIVYRDGAFRQINTATNEVHILSDKKRNDPLSQAIDCATIQGVAGTGKTLIAKEAARRFGAQGRKVLFLCFNRMLFGFLAHMYPYENVTYYNIHTFITRYATEWNDLSSPKDRAHALTQIDWDKLDFDDIIIDEGQDFDNDEIIYFKDYCELVNGHFFVFYDKNQMLTTIEVPKWIRESECKLVLTKNCRNTYEIALTSYNVIDVELNQKITMVNGDKTSISFVKGDPLMKLSRLIKYYTDDQNGYSLSDIVILSLKKEEDSILNGIHKISGIPISREQNNASILFTTAIKFKGLESRVIIITDIDESAFSSEEKKRVFYVACSRATQRLSLFINADEEGVKRIADSIGGSKRFAPQGKIVMKTQSQLMEL